MRRAGTTPRAVARLRRLSLLPAWAGVALLFLVPLLVIALYSLLTRGAYWGLGLPWTLENYARIFDPLYAVILLRSVIMAAAATALCLLLAFPAALFIPALGAYLTPELMGGGRSIMIGNLIQNQFTTARNWPFGAAVSLALMAVAMLLLFAFLRRRGEELL